MKRRPPPIRIILIVLLCMLAGAIVNVAVAWGLAEIVLGGTPYGLEEREIDAQGLAWWNARAPEDVTGTPDCILEGYPSRQFEVTIFRQKLSSSIDPQANRFRVGWPLRSMERSIWHAPNSVVHGLDSLVVRFPVHMELPLRPVSSGFAINTVFYAFIVWLLFIVPFALRKRRRIKRGLCVKCAYPRGTSEVCTECGHRVAPRAMASTT